jgi:hypothetical protein
LLSRQDFWEHRLSWLAEKQPIYTKAGESLSNVISMVDELAAKHAISVPMKQPNEPSERPGMTAAVLSLRVLGEMKPVMNWLHELQQPGHFITVPAMTITPNDEDTSKIEVNMRIEKWFRLPTP